MSTFVDSLLDLLTPLGGVTARKMFGGYGIYKETLMFGLVAYDRLFLRTDEVNRDKFIDQGCEPFVFGKDKEGKEIVSKYYEPPEMAFANEKRMKVWALSAWECALRSAKETAVRKEQKARRKARKQAGTADDAESEDAEKSARKAVKKTAKKAAAKKKAATKASKKKFTD